MPFAELDKVKINYHQIGEGAPIVFVSGLGLDHRAWLFQIPVFKEFFKVIVLDNRGLGKSTCSLGTYSTELMADDIKALIDHLKIKKTHMLGSSMGGMISQEFAIKYPDNIDKLVLCSTSAKPENEVIKIVKKGVKSIFKGEDNIFKKRPPIKLIRNFLNFFLGQVFSEDFIINNKDLIKRLIEDYASNPRYFETFMKQSKAVYHHDTLKDISKIKAETMIITGNNDRLLPPSSSDILAEEIPNSSIVKIPNGTHGLHYEMPDKFNKIVLDFLRN